MPCYESTFIARQDMSKQDVTKLADQFSEIISNGGGKVVKSEYWGLKTLSYRINKSRKGHYSMLAIDAPADAIKELERNMRLNEDVVRVLTIRVESVDDTPSIMMNQNKRDEAGSEASDEAA